MSEIAISLKMFDNQEVEIKERKRIPSFSSQKEQRKAPVKKSFDSWRRSLVKSFSWRAIAFVDTFLVTYLVSTFLLEGSTSTLSLIFQAAFWIALLDFFVKISVYYFHERFWQQIISKNANIKQLSLKKSFSWRIVATTLTFVTAGAILEDFGKAALLIAICEFASKFVLYFYHEKIWEKFSWGKTSNA